MSVGLLFKYSIPDENSGDFLASEIIISPMCSTAEGLKSKAMTDASIDLIMSSNSITNKPLLFGSSTKLSSASVTVAKVPSEPTMILVKSTYPFLLISSKL